MGVESENVRSEESIPARRPVSVIIPVLNEEAYIESCVAGLQAQTGCNIVEFIIADGGSTDTTIAKVNKMMQRDARIKLMHNPRRVQAAAVNLAAESADPGSDVFVRADAHMTYAPDYVARCVEALRTHQATSVVVSMRTVGRTSLQRAVAAAQNSVVGNGGSAHRSSGQVSRFIEHGHHAAFDRTFFRKCCGYDEYFHPNEDFEFDHRSRLAGGRIWLEVGARLYYYPRDNLRALARQYFYIGKGRGRSHIRHRLPPKFRQLLPALLVIITFGGFALSLLWWPAAFLPASYILSCLLSGVMFALREGDVSLLAAGPAAIVMHLSYGAGTLYSLLASTKHLLRKMNSDRHMGAAQV